MRERSPESGPAWLVTLDDAAGVEASDLGPPSRALSACCRNGIPVPPGFVLTRSLREEAARAGGLPADFAGALDEALARLEHATGTRRDDPLLPLLIDLAPDADGGRAVGFSRLGLSRRSLEGLVARTGDPARAERTLVALVKDFATRVHGAPRDAFDDATLDDADAALARYELFVGAPFPESLEVQLRAAVEVLLETERLRLVRRLAGSGAGPRGPGLLVTTSVIGSAGAESGVGLLRWNLGRSADVTVRYRPDVDGFDDAPALDEDGLRRLAPRVYGQLEVARRLLERQSDAPVGFEFAAEEGRLFLLAVARASSGSGERAAYESAVAAGVATIEVVEGAAPSLEAECAEPRTSSPARHTVLLDDAVVAPVAQGSRLARGVAAGRLVFTLANALHCRRAGLPTILVRSVADVDDLGDLSFCDALIFVGEPGDTRIEAIAARAGRPALLLSDLELDTRAACMRVDGQLLREGDPVTVDAEGGRLFLGELTVVEAEAASETDATSDATSDAPASGSRSGEAEAGAGS